MLNRKVVGAVLIGAALICGGMAVNGFVKEQTAGSTYEDLQEEVKTETIATEQPAVQEQEPPVQEEPAEEPVVIPVDFAKLQELPGVGRKTANVVMSVGFNAPAIAVDTHVFRVSNRLKLAAGDTPLAVEQGLMKAIPKDKWSAAHHWLIWHGRNICKARKPLCDKCPLAEVCPSREVLAEI